MIHKQKKSKKLNISIELIKKILSTLTSILLNYQCNFKHKGSS